MYLIYVTGESTSSLKFSACMPGADCSRIDGVGGQSNYPTVVYWRRTRERRILRRQEAT